MNKSFLALIAAIGLIVGFGVGYAVHSGGSLGATIGYQSSLNNALTFTAFNSILTDLNTVRAPLAGVSVGTSNSLQFTLVSATTTNSTATVVTGLAASVGDIVLVSPNTAESSTNFFAQVGVASTTSATINITAISNLNGLTAETPASTTFNVTVIPKASFVAPAALVTATSSSSN